MTITKELIYLHIGDTLQRDIEVTLNGTAGGDMTGWTLDVELVGNVTLTAAVDNLNYVTTSKFPWVITDEQTATLTAGTWPLYGKLKVTATGEEFTVMHSTVVVTAEGVA